MASKQSSTSGARTAPKSSKASTNGPNREESHTSSGEVEELIVEHIGRYRLSIVPVIAKLFFNNDAKQAQEVLRDLKRRGLVQAHGRLFNGGYSSFQLTVESCEKLRLSKHRAAEIKGQALVRNLAVLWFATMKGAKRARLPDDVLPPGCPIPPGEAPHVIEVIAPERARIYRLQVAEKGGHKYPFDQIARAADQFQAIPNGLEFMTTGAYAFAVLVNTEDRKALFESALPEILTRIPQGAKVVVETVPSPDNIPAFLN
jgi:hypothetical protein